MLSLLLNEMYNTSNLNEEIEALSNMLICFMNIFNCFFPEAR